MKKTQMALAAVALVASSAALADGVKISGALEGAIATTTGNGAYFSGAGGWVAGNNIRFSGAEDLGGGTKAVFGLEAGLDLNGYSNNGGATYGGAGGSTNGGGTGPNGSGLFSREASVGLSNDQVGTLKLGRQLSPAVLGYASTGTLGNGHFFVNRLASVGGGNVAGGGTNHVYEGFWVDNAVTYSSPDLNGFSVNFMQQMRNGNTNGTVLAGAVDDSYTSYAINGAVGPLKANVTYEKRNTAYANWGFNANTKLGDFSLAGSYHSIRPTGNPVVSSYSLEGGYNISEPLMVMVQWAANDAANQADLMALSAKYAMSGRTFAYFSYLNGTNVASSFDTRNAPAAGGASSRTTIVGIAHSF